MAFRHYKKLDKRLNIFQDKEFNSKRQQIGVFSCGNIKQFEKLLKKINITIRKGQRFQSWIDTGVFYCKKNVMIQNTSPDYRKVIDYSLEELIEKNRDDTNPICIQNSLVLLAVEGYIDRIKLVLQHKISSEENHEDIRESLKKTCVYYERMKYEKAETLEDALQRILFWSDLFWQTGHTLMGLGRLDLVLDRFKVSDQEETLSIIEDFFDSLHRYYPFKSGEEALGDTGQIIILGGDTPDGNYFCNEYTYLFIKALTKHSIPDPKLLLRVSDKMPEPLLQNALKCIATGVGSPLLSNDTIVIPTLKEFGYQENDSYNYVTSACWEPLIFGKSSDVNNIRSINYAKAIVLMYQNDNFLKCQTYDEILKLYFEMLDQILLEVIATLDNMKWEYDPLLTLFTEGCVESRKDISVGGAVYKNYGVLGDGFGNAVNSLLFIKNSIFRDKAYTLQKIKNICESDYADEEERIKIFNLSNYYGKSEEDVLEMANRIKMHIYTKFGSYQNKLGGKLKWGVSSSNYMINGRTTAATMDGRRSKQPLSVHISASGYVPYTELINFASSMDYCHHAFNGNVVDFIVSRDIIVDNFEKFLSFLKISIKKGFFQLQMNVVSSDQLMEAKIYPKKYPQLIVRVWGFSAYFSDLPENYQNLLIKRALISEGKDEKLYEYNLPED